MGIHGNWFLRQRTTEFSERRLGNVPLATGVIAASLQFFVRRLYQGILGGE
jgi:hypothetical protein